MGPLDHGNLIHVLQMLGVNGSLPNTGKSDIDVRHSFQIGLCHALQITMTDVSDDPFSAHMSPLP
ncbi:hypothetical protein D3C76_1787720 [compost metagenome]